MIKALAMDERWYLAYICKRIQGQRFQCFMVWLYYLLACKCQITSRFYSKFSLILTELQDHKTVPHTVQFYFHAVDVNKPELYFQQFREIRD